MIIRFILITILVCASPYAFGMGSVPSASQREVFNNGTLAPEFTLETTLGGNQSLSQARGGKRAMVIFWASWCPHCNEELESLSQKLDEVKQKNIQVLLVNVGESKDDAKAYLERIHLPLDSFLDEDNAISGQYGVVGIPTIIFIDEKGFLRAVEHGLPDDLEAPFNSK